MDIGPFCHLHDLVQKKLEAIDENQAMRSRSFAICSQIRLALTIWHLTYGSHWDVQDGFELSDCEYYHSLRRKIDAINSQVRVELDIGNEATPLKLK